MIKNLKNKIRTTFLFSISCLFLTDGKKRKVPTNMIESQKIVNEKKLNLNKNNKKTKTKKKDIQVIKKKKFFYYLIFISKFLIYFVFSWLFFVLGIIIFFEKRSFLKGSLLIFFLLILKLVSIIFLLKISCLAKKWIFFLKIILGFIFLFCFFPNKGNLIEQNKFFFYICFFLFLQSFFFYIEDICVIYLYKNLFFQNLKNNLVIFFSSFAFNLLYFIVVGLLGFKPQ